MLGWYSKGHPTPCHVPGMDVYIPEAAHQLWDTRRKRPRYPWNAEDFEGGKKVYRKTPIPEYRPEEGEEDAELE